MLGVVILIIGYAECRNLAHYAECHYAACNLNVLMLTVICADYLNKANHLAHKFAGCHYSDYWLS